MRMTIAELRDILRGYPDDARVIFTPDDYCGSGYPEWERCSPRLGYELDGEEREVPSGIVFIDLKDERDL